MQGLRDNIHRLCSHLLPTSCILCRRSTLSQRPLCQPCQKQLPFNTHACPSCALPLPASAPTDTPCGSCQHNKPPYDGITAPFYYAEPISHLINRFKHQGAFYEGAVLADILATNLAKDVSAQWPDFIVPVPLHWRRQFYRGFNQADWLARRISRQLEIPVKRNLITRVAATPPQQGLGRQKRLQNLKQAFRLQKSFSDATIAVVDDVITTGSTLATIATLLKLNGASRVYGWCLARTGVEKDRG